MQLKQVALKDLLVNKANDRHGELLDENQAIDWLLTNKATHMKNLAKDVAKSGEIYEIPLVAKDGENYTVYDGNRRVTTLKLLQAPQLAPTEEWAKFYSDQKRKWVGTFPKSISCQIENDLERIDEILFRRHNGQQGGVGQSGWEDDAKTNFQRRTGKNTRINVAEEVEKLLHSSGRLDADERIPRSNMNRLLSAEQFRNRAGFAIEDNSLKLTHNKDTVFNALERISRDLISGTVTLDKIWDNKSKRRYLDQIDQEGVLPKADDLLEEKQDSAKEIETKSPPKSKKNKGANLSAGNRKHLIRGIDIDILPTADNRKALDILFELQNDLEFGKHDNAISVLFRVLLELSMKVYVENEHVKNCGNAARLSEKLENISAHMLSKALIDKKYYEMLEKFKDGESLFSANTLNAYIHNADFFPSEKHLMTMWDNLQKFVLICLSSKK